MKPHMNTCPLCGSIPTDFHESYSEGEDIMRVPWDRQTCSSRSCGLPCRLWDKVQKPNHQHSYERISVAVLLGGVQNLITGIEALRVGLEELISATKEEANDTP